MVAFLSNWHVELDWLGQGDNMAFEFWNPPRILNWIPSLWEMVRDSDSGSGLWVVRPLGGCQMKCEKERREYARTMPYNSKTTKPLTELFWNSSRVAIPYSIRCIYHLYVINICHNVRGVILVLLLQTENSINGWDHERHCCRTPHWGA